MSGTPVITNVYLQDGDVIVHTYQDVEDIIEDNVEWQSTKQTGDFRKTSSIPLNLIDMFLTEQIMRGMPATTKWNDPELWDYINKKILRDPDWKKLRTTYGGK